MSSSRQSKRCSVAAVVVVIAVGLIGCGPETISEEQARSYVGEWAKQARESLQDQVDASDARTRFEKLARRAGEKASGEVRRTEPPYDALVREVYSSIGWRLRLASREGLTERGESIWSVVSKADRHALKTDPFDFEAIERTRERISKLDGRIDSVSSYEPSENVRRRARRWLKGRKLSEFALESDNYDRLVQALVETKAGKRLAERMEKIEKLYVDRADAVARLELLVARNTARYGRKMKHFRIRHVFIHEREDDYWRDPVTEGERPDEKKGPFVAGVVWRRAAHIADEMREPVKILHRRIRETLERTLTEEKPAKVLRELQPQHPQYAKLKKAYRRYQKIVEAGGWEEVSKEPYLDPGDASETVAALKKRLQVEGYYPEDASIDENYGEKLEKAIESYQETHQMRVTGEPHEMFWSSLSKPAKWRMRQIGLNLQRWRESNVRHSDPTYALVNIPGAHVELWQDQKRTMRFRIVVGNDASRYDKEKKETIHPNHTPEVSAYIDRVIYNPYWNITDRIRNTEILPQARQSVENKYKEKLRRLREKKRRLKRARASSRAATGGSKSKNESNESEKNKNAKNQRDRARGSREGSGTKLLVARGPERGNAGTGSGSNSGDSEGKKERTKEEKSNSNSGDSGAKKEAAKEEKSKPVAIDDLYEMVPVDDKVKKVDEKTLFDVAKIRKLLGDVERLSKDTDSKPSGGSGAKSSKSSSQEGRSAKASSKAGTETEKGSEKEPKTPLEKKFPYLDPKTGFVDVSTTDPDNVPKWYEKEGYEVMFPGKKWEYVRMKQGRQNALGRVKVIFPNRHSVYLHDTPKKKLFERNIRAFSHGCMRMDKPLEFAKTLLKKDGLYSEIDVESLLNDKERVRAENDPDKKWKYKYEYRPVFLEKQVPVHVDYFTVRVDDQGRPNFYADIYDEDARRLESAKDEEQ